MTICQHSVPVDTTLMDMGDSFVAEDLLIKSPCRLRPDTHKPCPLLAKHKNNTYCESCGLINPDKTSCKVHTDAELLVAIYNGIGETQLNTPKTPKQTKPRELKKVCVWCGKKIVRSMHCERCGKRIRDRKCQWRRQHGNSEPPFEWLYRPKHGM